MEDSEQVARNIDVDELSDDTPDGVTFHETMDGNVFVQTDRFQSVISPDKLESWIQGDDRLVGETIPSRKSQRSAHEPASCLRGSVAEPSTEESSRFSAGRMSISFVVMILQFI